MRQLTIGTFILLFCLSAQFANAQTRQPAASGFDKLKALVGEWEGKNSSGAARTLKLELVSGGSALQETLKDGDNETMVTLYHQDGKRLLATHYCSAGNQPRLVASALAPTAPALKFRLLDVTNLAAPTAGHMFALAFNFLDADHFEQLWVYREKGKNFSDTFSWTRRQ